MVDRLQLLSETKIVCVLRGPTADGTLRAVQALVAGGITGIEVTYSTPDATKVIATLREEYGERVLLGAGTVRTAEQATEAATAGATFLVSPGATERLAAAMRATGLLTLMGAMTPSEVLSALEWGADVVKLFPASLGGIPFLRSLKGPFPDVRFCPTGGVNPGNVTDWLSAGAFAVGAGSELCSATDIAEERWDKITAMAARFAQAARE